LGVSENYTMRESACASDRASEREEERERERRGREGDMSELYLDKVSKLFTTSHIAILTCVVLRNSLLADLKIRKS
jgi:hypothetical protein